MSLLKYQPVIFMVCALFTIGCADGSKASISTDEATTAVRNEKKSNAPSDIFDLASWSLTIPFDFDQSGSADSLNPKHLQNYQLAEFFYLDENKHLVMVAPNKAVTTPNSTNTRTEFRQVFAEDTDQFSGLPNAKNYFALASNSSAAEFASIGSGMAATLKVNHVSLNAKYTNKAPAYSVVVGQIHAGKLTKLRTNNSGFGWGNEPLKIYYKKFPHHQTGSVFWTYERNLTKEDPNRIDIDYPVWGVGWENTLDPKNKGLALGEEFSYSVKVINDIMHLEFSSANHPTVHHQINLANNLDANGNVDLYDDPQGYKQDWLFFKAGTYNQCSTKDAPSFRYPACPGTGDWQKDKADGNYASVTFSKLELLPAGEIN